MELICSLLTLLILKFVKNVEVHMVMRSITSGVCTCLACEDVCPIHIFTQKARTHTRCYASNILLYIKVH